MVFPLNHGHDSRIGFLELNVLNGKQLRPCEPLGIPMVRLNNFEDAVA